MTEFKQSRVSREVWRWLDPPWAERAPGMSPRVKVLISTPIAFLIAYGMYRFGHRVGPILVCTIATGIAICGLFIPRAFGGIERFFMGFAAVVAVALTWGLLVPVFLLIFTPGAIALKLRGKDPLHRRCPTEHASYWTDRPPITRENYYRSQH